MKKFIARPLAVPPAKHPLTEDEWCFTQDRVADVELVPCILWEYLRESQTVRQLAEDWSTLFASPIKGQDQTSLWNRTKEIRPVINFPLRVDVFVECIIVQQFGHQRLMDCSWQRLDPERRREHIVEFCQLSPPAFIGSDWHASILEQSLKEKSTDPGSAMKDARAMLNGSMNGQEAVLLVIDWANYNDAAIQDALANFVRGLKRPEGVEPRIRRASGEQRNTEWRGMLNSLGMARLHARYHANQLRKEVPRAYRHHARMLSDGGPTAVEKKLAAGSRRFEKRFHEILQFEKQPPSCIATGRLAK